jgi:Zn-dependent protease
LKCDYCGKEEALPFVCNFCGGLYCGDHRLPESHQCKGDLSQKRTITAPPQTTFSWQTQEPVNTIPTTRQANVFSRIEIRDIVIAWLALGFAFSLSFFSRSDLFGGGGLDASGFGYIFLLSLLTVGPGFVLHELSHKFVAQRYGFWAEFRMWPMGLVLALVTSLLGFIFAAPGATYISGVSISKQENGKISLAGPATNVVLAMFFLPFAITGNGFLADLGGFGSYINIFLALFNLLPIGPLDGSKVFRWSKPLWVVFFVGLAGLFYFLYFA